MITDKEMLSSPNNSTLDSDRDQNISPVFTAGNLSVEDGVNNNDLSSGSDLIDCTTIVNQVQNGNSILESSVLKDEADNGNLNHSRCISQSSTSDGNVTSLPKKVLKKRNTISTSSIMKHKTKCCKIFIIFAICCIIGIFLIPIIGYYVNQTSNDAEVDTEYSHETEVSLPYSYNVLTV